MPSHPDIVYIENSRATARLSLFGAQVLSFTPKHDGRERLWLSAQAVLDGSKAIRGGVPICWPWFGKPSNCDLPAHGFARTSIWSLVSRTDLATETILTLQLPPQHNADMLLQLTISIGDTLSLRLDTFNSGQNAFEFTCALHSYFKVSAIDVVSLTGLEGTYEDKTQDGLVCHTPSPYTFAGETDRIHHCAAKRVQILDNGVGTRIESTGHDSIVVWNPGSQRCLQMSDMAATGFTSMLCVETAITTPAIVEPGSTHSLTQTIR